MSQFINFQNLKLKKTKNQYLALPEKIMYTSSPDVFSPNFICKVEDLKNSFEGVIDKQPRISKKFYDSERNKFKCIQKTKFFKFPDLIDVEFIKIKIISLVLLFIVVLCMGITILMLTETE